MSGRWHPTYRRIVLERGFEYHRTHFFSSMLDISLAHVLQLTRQNIIRLEEGRSLVAALKQVRDEGPEVIEYDERFEDLFFVLEHRLTALVGDETVGNLHVALSRNDLDTTMYRLVLREEVLAIGALLTRLRRTLLEIAEQHVTTVMPAYTHGQQAQPTTFGHYIAAVEAEFAKDHERLLAMWPRLNRSPMGAAALATSGYPVDREFVAELLGFDGLVENSYEAVASADFSAEYAAWALLWLGHVSRFVTDLLFWVANEVAAIRLHPSFIQVSSIMPQKRNPVALEHLRAFTTRAMGVAQGVVGHMHNVPFGDVNDVNDDLQPTLRYLTREIADVASLLVDVVGTMEVDRQLLHRRAAESFAPVTELADVLVREGKLPFRTAHRIVSDVVSELTAYEKQLADLDLALLNDVAERVTGQRTRLTAEQLRIALDPVHFVAVRRVRGGPAPDEMRRYLTGARERLNEHSGAFDRFADDICTAKLRREQMAEHFIRKGVMPA